MRHHLGVRYIKIQLFLILSMMFCATTMLSGTASAAPATESITLSPTSRNFTIDAGKIIDDSLTIINDGETAYDFLVYARPYSVSNEAYDPNFTLTPSNADVYEWAQFPQTKYHLEVGKSVKVKYSLHVPVGARPGGHYGVIFAETQAPDGATTGNSIIRKKRVGSIIYATVNGSYKTAGEAVASDIPFWQVQPPLHTSVTAKNTGNTDFTDTVRLTVKDVFGGIKYDSAKDYQVLPQTTRKISLDWDKSSWFGLYKVEATQRILGRTTDSNGYVLMMPRYLPIALVVVLLIGGAYAWFRRKKH